MAVDRNITSFSKTTDEDSFPFLALELPGAQPVSRVVLNFNAIQDLGLKNIQIRVADSRPTTGDSEFTDGTRIGFFQFPIGGAGEVRDFIASPNGMTGKFVVVQMLNNKQFFSMAEVQVFA